MRHKAIKTFWHDRSEKIHCNLETFDLLLLQLNSGSCRCLLGLLWSGWESFFSPSGQDVKVVYPGSNFPSPYDSTTKEISMSGSVGLRQQHPWPWFKIKNAQGRMWFLSQKCSNAKSIFMDIYDQQPTRSCPRQTWHGNGISRHP